MKPSTELFDLIKSLTKSEKRFFKLASSLQTGDKNYLKIFDAIDRQSNYDENTIKGQFKNETFISLGFVPEIIGLLSTLVFHLLWRQPLISIVGGTAIYMVLVQMGFMA